MLKQPVLKITLEATNPPRCTSVRARGYGHHIPARWHSGSQATLKRANTAPPCMRIGTEHHGESACLCQASEYSTHTAKCAFAYPTDQMPTETCVGMAAAKPKGHSLMHGTVDLFLSAGCDRSEPQNIISPALL